MLTTTQEPPRLTPDGEPWPLTTRGKPIKARRDGYPNQSGAGGRASAVTAKLNPEKTRADRSRAGKKGGAGYAKWAKDNPEAASAIARLGRSALPAEAALLGSFRGGAAYSQWAKDNPEENIDRIQVAITASVDARSNPDVPSAVDYEGNEVRFLSHKERDYFLGRQKEGVKIRKYRSKRDGRRRVWFNEAWSGYYPDFVEEVGGGEVAVEVKGYRDLAHAVSVENSKYRDRATGDLSLAKFFQHPDVKWVFNYRKEVVVPPRPFSNIAAGDSGVA